MFFAIILDHDLADLQSYENLHTTLEQLRKSALTEDSAAFDPSGSSNQQHDEEHSKESYDLARSWHGEVASSSGATEDTDLTSTSRKLERVHLEDFLHDQANEALSNEEKAAKLKEMFPEIKDFDIEWTLRKGRYDFGKAVEELLNQTFLMEGADTGGPLAQRGIEGFAESDARPRRKKKAKKAQTRTDPAVEKISNDAQHSSRWDRVRGDIEFLEQRTFLPRDVISSKYHRSGATLASTIAALCASDGPAANPYITNDTNDILETHAIDMAPEFPTLSYTQISGLVRLSHPSTTSARELARALVSSLLFEPTSKIIPQYLPRPPSLDEIPVSPPSPAPSHLDPSAAAALANSRSTAYTQAQSAFRKSKSNPHFGGAAAYYSQVGRDASTSLQIYEAAAADELVASQSTKAGEIDLHGVNARDAVRISKARVGSWWEREAREWSRSGKPKQEFRIVTGRGHHSTGGKGVLGPAVFKALVNGGWKVRMEQGYIIVSGQVKN